MEKNDKELNPNVAALILCVLTNNEEHFGQCLKAVEDDIREEKRKEEA